MLDVKIEARTNLATTEMCECRSDLILDRDKQLEYVRVHLAGVVEHDVLSRQFQQHGVVEELVDGDVLREPLSPPRLDHELPGQRRRRLRLQRPDGDGLVERVAGHDLPVVEHGEAEGLALRVRPQVRLEAEGVDGRDEGLDRVEGRAGHGRVLRHVTPAAGQHCVDGRDAIGGGLKNARFSLQKGFMHQRSSFQMATGIELHIVFASKLPALRRTCKAP